MHTIINRLLAREKDLEVVSMSDAVLVADLKYAQRVYEVVKQLKLVGKHQSENHPFDYRPWVV